jgi:hypothetical protein
MARLMRKTKKFAEQRFDIYTDGRKAAEHKEPRFAPYIIFELARTWFAGYDSVKQNNKTLDK